MIFSCNEKKEDAYIKKESYEYKNTFTSDGVKKAYRKMALTFHPDKLHGVSNDIKKLANEKFIAVKDAYEKIIQTRQ